MVCVGFVGGREMVLLPVTTPFHSCCPDSWWRTCLPAAASLPPPCNRADQPAAAGLVPGCCPVLEAVTAYCCPRHCGSLDPQQGNVSVLPCGLNRDSFSWCFKTFITGSTKQSLERVVSRYTRSFTEVWVCSLSPNVVPVL